ncbi:hypothetical protein [Tsuneonella suprasediminis]|uniref:hypothetical protein n=1 Tax=Tsuneonella suprasediminis TaxID=2306996 RepID=UPI002F95B829
MTEAIITGWILAGLSVVLIRMGWGGRRSVARAGWALAIVSLVLLARQAGAWGMATGFTVGMIVALLIVLYAAWRSPAKLRRVGRQVDAAVVLPGSAHLARRFAVFVLVVPVAFAAAQWLAFAIQAYVRGGAPIDANSFALMLILQPVIWTILMTWQMTLSNPVRMIGPPLIAAVLGALAWGLS